MPPATFTVPAADQWTAKDWAIDTVDKYVRAWATGTIFDRTLDPNRQS